MGDGCIFANVGEYGDSLRTLLIDEFGLEVRYWLARQSVANNVGLENVVHQRVLDSWSGIFPAHFDTCEVYSARFCEFTQDELAEYEQVALEMLSRVSNENINKTRFSYSERVRSFHRSVSIWLNVVDQLQIGLVIFDDRPHNISTYSLYTVCEILELPKIIIFPIHFGKVIIESAIGEEISPNNDYQFDLTTDFEEQIKSIRSDDWPNSPNFEREMRKIRSLGALFNSATSRMRSIIQQPTQLLEPVDTGVKVAKVRSHRLEDRREYLYEYLINQVRKIRYLKQLKQNYHGRTTKPDFTQNYIYYPLHYQPERTTSPDGGWFSNQLLLASLLSYNNLDLPIYIKEHPQTFNPSREGHKKRTMRFYDDLQNLPNTHFIDTSTHSFRLIDNAVAVITITGSSGYESILRGTPSLVFGNAWYDFLPDVFEARNIEDLNDILDILNNDTKVGYKKVENKLREYLTKKPNTNMLRDEIDNPSFAYISDCINKII